MNVTLYLPTKTKIRKVEFETGTPESTTALKQMNMLISTEYFLLKTKPGELLFEDQSILTWLDEVKKSTEIYSYSNYNQVSNAQASPVPTIDYSAGSLRDDFNFGALVLLKTSALTEYLKWESQEYKYAGWYALSLFASRQKQLHHSNKFNYSYTELDVRKSGEKQFDYVNPRNRARQLEMEKAATIHLEAIGAKVSPPFKQVDFDETSFQFEASVIIPVLNRELTITDAIQSVLKQQTNFAFNLIIVNNHSTDDTTKIINEINDDRIIHVIPEATNLGIGGCWNEAVNHPKCGRFAVQLDSDDLYSDESTLQRIVDKFHKKKCAMVIGSYQMVNVNLEEIPPGIIDHREWTDDNGPNNALRINGMGAPRAFYTPIIREIGFPNVSYGEDYAVALAISRSYKIGRIYEPLYLCRRWNQNTDANLSIEKTNAHNKYKDSIRTEEIAIRKELNK
ncbi:MAG: glycosyltransferase family 2 protein [Prolixibacteraceae bacterium]